MANLINNTQKATHTPVTAQFKTMIYSKPRIVFSGLIAYGLLLRVRESFNGSNNNINKSSQPR